MKINWRAILAHVAFVQTTIFLSVAYILLIPWFLLRRLFVLRRMRQGWHRWTMRLDSIEEARRQY